MNSMKEPSSTSFKLERAKINEVLSKQEEYTDEDILIKKWEGNNTFGNYLAEITKDGTQFIGILNSRLEKEGYGYYRFQNNDHYFGSFKYDQRNYNGFYIWPQEEKGNNIIHTESYHGFWKDNKKYKYGIYLWLDEEDENEDFEKANFQAFVGQFDGNTYIRGTFLKKDNDNYYLYHGDFTPDGKKNDEKAFFYSSSLDRLFHGKIENDIFKDGYISYFNDDGLIDNVVYYDFESDKSVKKMVMQEDINEEGLKREKDECSLFRNVILSIDYFGEIYKTYKNTVKFLTEEMGEMSIFEDKEKFVSLMKIAVAYNKNNIYLILKIKQSEEGFRLI